MKVFLSSVIRDFESYRDAGVEAIETLGHIVVRSEQFVASPDSAQVACLRGIRESDAVVLVLGERYGPTQASGLSATHEEFREARDSKPTLVFVQTGITPEPVQRALIREARNWSQGAIAASFATASELQRAVLRALHELELARAAGPLDQDDMLDRALACVPDVRNTGGEASLAVAVACGPRQAVVRPAELEAAQLARDLKQEVLFGSAALFDPADGTKSGMASGCLRVEQSTAWLSVDAEGTVVVARRIHRTRTHEFMRALIEEEVREDLEQVLRFVDGVLERVDPTHRLTHVVVVAALIGAAHGAWLTRAERAASPGSMPMNIARSDRPVAHLSPPAKPRQALRHQAGEVAQDLTVLLRRASVR